MRCLILVGLILALVAAGCFGDAPVEAADVHAGADEDGPLPPLGLAGSDCREGGGHSVHPRSLWAQGMVRVVPPPWVPADVIEDVGEQITYSEIPDPLRPIPEEGNTMGNYHATMWCEQWSLDGHTRDDLFVGFVGMRVEPPDFDEDAATPTHHYVVTVVVTNDETLLERLRAGGIHAVSGAAQHTTVAPDLLRIQMQTDGNGDYDSIFVTRSHGEMHATHVRLWWQHDLDGHGGHADHSGGPHANGQFKPIALDLLATGGTHHVGAAQGWFSHTGTDHHAPLPGAYGKTAAAYYDGFDRTFEWGPRPDVTLSQAYVH